MPTIPVKTYGLLALVQVVSERIKPFTLVESLEAAMLKGTEANKIELEMIVPIKSTARMFLCIVFTSFWSN
jgi:hypothetical protein